MTKIILTIFFLLFSCSIFSEIVYLKDGQIFEGEIINEDKTSVTIRTRFEKRIIPRDEIKRVLYGEREMESVYIQMKDNSILNVFLVDQDSQKIIVRDSKKSGEERVILKKDVKNMSREEIFPLNPEVILRSGFFIPVNSGGSDLKSGFGYIGGFSITPPVSRRLRLFVEIGYTKLNSDSIDGLSMKFIPATIGFSYRFPLYKHLSLEPRLHAGAVVVDFDDGHGEKARGYDMISQAGAGLIYEVWQRHLSIAGFLEYSIIYEKGTMFNAVQIGLGMVYLL